MQSNNTGTNVLTGPKTIVKNVQPCQLFAVEYLDARGKTQHSVVLLMAGQAYVHGKNHAEWAKELRLADPVIQEAVQRAMATAGQPTAPSNDAVDVLA